MEKEINVIIPTYVGITEFQKGQSSKLFKDLSENDKVMIVNKQNKPQAVIISYERYIRIKNGEENL